MSLSLIEFQLIYSFDISVCVYVTWKVGWMAKKEAHLDQDKWTGDRFVRSNR